MDAEKDIVEGFNAGYLIEKYKPELARELVKSLSDVELPFAEGFVSGSKEYSKERGRSKLRKGYKIHPPSKFKDKGMDKDR